MYVAKEDDERSAKLSAAFERAHRRAAAYIAENPHSEQLLEILRSWNGSTADGIDAIYRQVLSSLAPQADRFFGDLAPNLDSFARAAQEGVGHGVLTSAPDNWNDYLWSTR